MARSHVPVAGLAEREGFEPPVACATLVFKTSSFDHSDNAPGEG